MQLIISVVADENGKHRKGGPARNQSHCDGPPQVTGSPLAAFKSDEEVELPHSKRGWLQQRQ